MDKAAVKLAPSILVADFARLGEQVAAAEQAGADHIHVDVMDGHFVPSLSMGAAVVQSLRRVTSLPLEIHLMITNPDLFLNEFVNAGADSFLVQWEGNDNLHFTVQRIKALRKTAGVVINPATPVAVLEDPARCHPSASYDGKSAFWASAFPAFDPAKDPAGPPNGGGRQIHLRGGGGPGASMQKLHRWHWKRELTF